MELNIVFFVTYMTQKLHDLQSHLLSSLYTSKSHPKVTVSWRLDASKLQKQTQRIMWFCIMATGVLNVVKQTFNYLWILHVWSLFMKIQVKVLVKIWFDSERDHHRFSIKNQSKLSLDEFEAPAADLLNFSLDYEWLIAGGRVMFSIIVCDIWAHHDMNTKTEYSFIFFAMRT